MRILKLILIFILTFSILGGRWDNAGISRQNYAMTVALNGTHNNVGCFIQCADPISPENADSPSTSNIIVTGSGSDISTALGSATGNSSKTITYEHLQLIVLGRDIYESCAAERMQYFVSSTDVQKSVDIVITDGDLSKMLISKPGGEPFFDYVTGLLSSDLPSKSTRIPGSALLTACRRPKDGHPFFMNKIHYDEKGKTVFFDGIGVFSGDIYRGYVSAEEWENSRRLEPKNGDFFLSCAVNGYGEAIGFHCISTACSLSAKRKNDGFDLSADIKAKSVLNEYQGKDPESVFERDFYIASEKALEKEVKKRCEKIV